MHNIDGINISDVNPDRVCLNCKHWQVLVQLKSPADGVVCRLTNERTGPTDTCGSFSPNSTFDSIQGPNRYHDKSDKMHVFKRF